MSYSHGLSRLHDYINRNFILIRHIDFTDLRRRHDSCILLLHRYLTKSSFRNAAHILDDSLSSRRPMAKQ